MTFRTPIQPRVSTARLGWLGRLLGVLGIVCSVYADDAVVSTPGLDRIDHIELLDPDLVTVHFDTRADKGYELEFKDNPFEGGAGVGGEWKLLFSVPAIPFDNHYVIPDTRASGSRVYRLRITQ